MLLTNSTRIRTVDGDKPIHSIVPGDYVVTPNGMAKVLSNQQSCAIRLINVRTYNYSLICDPTQFFFAKKGLMIASQLQQNQKIYCIEDNHFLSEAISKDTGNSFKLDYMLSLSNCSILNRMGMAFWSYILSPREKINSCYWLNEQQASTSSLEIDKDFCYYANGLLVASSERNYTTRCY